jgi:3,4-dihydroxy 2-butanone 4-phosphate synthase/GTP cyclohydrolase II
MRTDPIPFATVEEALEEIRQGRQIVLVDDEDRENEGDLTMAAEKITPEAINFMATHGAAWCVCHLLKSAADDLRLPLMSPENTSNFGTAFTANQSTRGAARPRASALTTAPRPFLRGH